MQNKKNNPKEEKTLLSVFRSNTQRKSLKPMGLVFIVVGLSYVVMVFAFGFEFELEEVVELIIGMALLIFGLLYFLSPLKSED